MPERGSAAIRMLLRQRAGEREMSETPDGPEVPPPAPGGPDPKKSVRIEVRAPSGPPGSSAPEVSLQVHEGLQRLAEMNPAFKDVLALFERVMEGMKDVTPPEPSPPHVDEMDET